MKRNLSAARLAILSHLEYRVDFFVDTIVQPVLSTGVELALWSTILSAAAVTQLNGFPRISYLSYVLWATFVARVTANWAYEMEMGEQIETGQINALLMRPISFYEYYLSQFVGYKLSTLPFSFLCPLAASLIFPTTVIWERFPAMLVLLVLYLFFTHTVAFCISCLGFHMTRTRGVTAGKNMALWMLTGELFPLDLIPDPLKTWVIHLPFASGVYIPVGFFIGRVGWVEWNEAVLSVAFGTAALGLFGFAMWRRGLRVYSGTGA